MKETIVNFDLAKIARLKGFKEYSSHLYDEKGILGINFHSEARTYKNSKEDNWNTAAPTLSLLQKWLREEHEISIKIDDFYTNSRIRFDYNICKLGSQEDNPQGVFETYELALEEALFEALKLI
jgi:hypothetical protein